MASISAFIRKHLWTAVWESRGHTDDVVASRGGIGTTQEQLDRSVKYAMDLLELDPHEDTLLDIGCGIGYMAKKMAPHAHRVVGVDNSESLVQRARKNLAEFDNVEVFKAGATNVEKPDGSFSKIMAYSIVIYFPSRRYFESFVEEVDRLLAPGGTALIADIPERGKYDFATLSRMSFLRRAITVPLTYLLSPFLYCRCSRKRVMEIANRLGLSARILDQPSDIVFHSTRFDLLVTKKRTADSAAK